MSQQGAEMLSKNINVRLPNELLTIMFQFLPFGDLKNAMLVCRFAQK